MGLLVKSDHHVVNGVCYASSGLCCVAVCCSMVCDVELVVDKINEYAQPSKTVHGGDVAECTQLVEVIKDSLLVVAVGEGLYDCAVVQHYCDTTPVLLKYTFADRVIVSTHSSAGLVHDVIFAYAIQMSSGKTMAAPMSLTLRCPVLTHQVHDRGVTACHCLSGYWKELEVEQAAVASHAMSSRLLVQPMLPINQGSVGVWADTRLHCNNRLKLTKFLELLLSLLHRHHQDLGVDQLLCKSFLHSVRPRVGIKSEVERDIADMGVVCGEKRQEGNITATKMSQQRVMQLHSVHWGRLSAADRSMHGAKASLMQASTAAEQHQ
eukprot:6459161-Amphidinium_carterae.1